MSARCRGRRRRLSPAPLPNIAKSELSPKDYSKTVKIEGKTVAIRGATFESMGDMASKGTGGGLISANCHGPAKFITPGSMTVKFEGKSVHLKGEPVLNNCGPSGSPPNTGATMMGTENPEKKKPPCPVHKAYKRTDKDRAAAKKQADDAATAADKGVADAKGELANAEAALAAPYKKGGPQRGQLRQAVKIAEGRVAAAEGAARGTKQKQKSLKNEQKVADDEGGGLNIVIQCVDCDHEIVEIDVLTADRRAKETKSSEGGFNKDQFDQMSANLADPRVVALLGGPVKPETAIVSADSAAAKANIEAEHPGVTDSDSRTSRLSGVLL